ncbi:MAG: lysophospholipid acyltransferase family protein [Inhella sp.]
MTAAPTPGERLRAVLGIGFGVLTVIPWGLTAVLLSPFLSATRLYWFCIAWVRLLFWGLRVFCGVEHRLTGLEHLPTGRREAVILLAKHQSSLETLALCMLMPHPLAFVFKRELLWIPFFGWALGRLDMVHIDRRRRAEAFNKVAEQGRRLAAQGHWVTMFPEGTRVERGAVGDYRPGGTRLAVATGVPVVPVACATARVLPRKSLVPRAGVYEISIGAPIAAVGRQPDELLAEVKGWIEAEMRRIDPEAYRVAAPPPSGAALSAR